MSTRPSATPRIEPTSLEPAGAFVTHAGLVLDEVSPTHVLGHIELTSDHHTPWGIVHGGVYSTAVESAASIGASTRRPGPGPSGRGPDQHDPLSAVRHVRT